MSEAVNSLPPPCKRPRLDNSVNGSAVRRSITSIITNTPLFQLHGRGGEACEVVCVGVGVCRCGVCVRVWSITTSSPVACHGEGAR